MGENREQRLFLLGFICAAPMLKVLCTSLHQPVLRGAGLASSLLCPKQRTVSVGRCEEVAVATSHTRSQAREDRSCQACVRLSQGKAYNTRVGCSCAVPL